MNMSLQAPFLFTHFNLHKGEATIWVVVWMCPIHGAMDQIPWMYSEVVWMNFFTNGAVNGSLIPSVNNSTVKSAKHRQVSGLVVYNNMVWILELMADHLIQMQHQNTLDLIGIMYIFHKLFKSFMLMWICKILYVLLSICCNDIRSYDKYTTFK